jgi:hypothetical protein
MIVSFANKVLYPSTILRPINKPLEWPVGVYPKFLDNGCAEFPLFCANGIVRLVEIDLVVLPRLLSTAGLTHVDSIAPLFTFMDSSDHSTTVVHEIYYWFPDLGDWVKNNYCGSVTAIKPPEEMKKDPKIITKISKRHSDLEANGVHFAALDQEFWYSSCPQSVTFSLAPTS